MYTRPIAAVLAILLVLTIAGCAGGTSVRTLSDPEANLTNYRTFAYFEPLGTDNAQYASIVSERLKAATTLELQARGFTLVDSEPDLLVNFSGHLQEKVRVTQTPTPNLRAEMIAGYYGYRTGLYATFPRYETNVSEYTEGTLNIDLVDAKARRLVWEGVGVRAVTRKTLDNIGPALNDTVAAIFARFPLPRQE
jgi:hypothetical protein